MVQAFTIPWSALDLTRAAKTLVRAILGDPWSVNKTASTSLREWCLGEVVARLLANMASIPGSAT